MNPAFHFGGSTQRGSTRRGTSQAALLLAAAFALLAAPALHAATINDHHGDAGFSFAKLLRLLTLQDYNTRVVLLGTCMLGLAAGTIGCFMLLRKRSLMGDAVSHATLPGIGIVFIVMTRMGMDGKSLPLLLLGGLISGLLGMATVLFLRRMTRLKEDAALGIVLSVYFGLGTSVIGIAIKLPTGNSAGLDTFIYGKTASMLASDAMLITIAAGVIVALSLLLFKEFTILTFDAPFAASQGWPVGRLDTILMSLAVLVTVIGLQSVGLILVVAMLIVPPASARFWTDHLPRMLLISGFIGGVSGLVGAAVSALLPNLPAGALIVLVACAFFLFSLVFGTARGVLLRLLSHWALNRKVGLENLLRELYENVEAGGPDGLDQAVADEDEAPVIGMSEAALLAARSWSPRELTRLLRRADAQDHIYRGSDGLWRFTSRGRAEARRIVRNHRLWEIFLITHADIATSRVDRGADLVEHVLGEEMTSKLERLLVDRYPDLAVPRSPHNLSPSGPSA